MYDSYRWWYISLVLCRKPHFKMTRHFLSSICHKTVGVPTHIGAILKNSKQTNALQQIYFSFVDIYEIFWKWWNFEWKSKSYFKICTNIIKWNNLYSI